VGTERTPRGWRHHGSPPFPRTRAADARRAIRVAYPSHLARAGPGRPGLNIGARNAPDKRRADLLDTNLDLLTDNAANTIVMSDIYTNRHSVEALNRVFDAYTNKITS
jgi:hypothetical protein